jgi:hypothetical protein
MHYEVPTIAQQLTNDFLMMLKFFLHSKQLFVSPVPWAIGGGATGSVISLFWILAIGGRRTCSSVFKFWWTWCSTYWTKTTSITVTTAWRSYSNAVVRQCNSFWVRLIAVVRPVEKRWYICMFATRSLHPWGLRIFVEWSQENSPCSFLLHSISRQSHSHFTIHLFKLYWKFTWLARQVVQSWKNEYSITHQLF